MKLDAPLWAVLMSYSVSFMVWFYVIFLIIVYGFRNVFGGIFLALSFGLAMRYKYYAAISEITFSIGLAGLLIGWLTRPAAYKIEKKAIWKHWLVTLLILIPLYVSHPLIIVPLLVVLGFDILYNNRWKDFQNWGIIIFLLGIYALKFYQVQGDTYEAGRMSLLDTSKVISIFTNLNDYKVTEILLWYFDKEYTFPFVVFLVLVLAITIKGKVLSGFYLLGATTCWLCLNILTYSYLKDHMLIMIDGYLAIFGMLWAIPIYFYLLHSKQKLFSFILVGSLIIFSLHRIYDKHKFYNDRLALIQETLDRHVTSESRKLLVPMEKFSWEVMWYPYEIPHESLMLSSLDGPENGATIFVDYDFNLVHEYQADTTVFYHFQLKTPVVHLPSKYFSLPKQPYQLITDVAWKE